MNIEKVKKYYIANRLVFNCGLLAILFFVNCFVPKFSYLAFFLVLVAIIFDKRQYGFSYLVFCVPFCGIDDYLGVYLLFGCVLAFLIKNYIIMLFFDKKRFSLYVLLSILAFTIYSLLPIGEYNSMLVLKLGISVGLVLLIYLFTNYKETLNLKFNLNVLAIGLIISAGFYLTYFVSPYIHDKVLWGMGEDFIRFSALLMNPNALAMICEISLSLLTIFLLQNKFEWNDIIAYIIFAVLGLSTFSKTFMILFGILLLILLGYLIRRYKWKITWLIVLICVVLILMVVVKGDFLSTYLNRFVGGWGTDMKGNNKFIDIMTTGRYKLWTTVVTYMFENPIVIVFGRGFGAGLVASMSAHNFYISLIYQLGLVGSLLFVLMFVMLIVDYKLKNPESKFKYSYLVPIVVLGLLMMVEDLFLYVY
ncbi:MAG TPA: hypothetical protein DD614_00250 [Clostridiales bacterium]|nr:hypothetical protein [Clostridiales bacterium]